MRLIQLTKGQYAQIDDEDFERVNAFKWHASAQGRTGDRYYACRFKYVKGKKVKVWLHRFVMGLPDSIEGYDPLVVDHDDGDGLNCQKENLSAVPWSKNLEFVNGFLRRKKEVCEPAL